MENNYIAENNYRFDNRLVENSPRTHLNAIKEDEFISNGLMDIPAGYQKANTAHMFQNGLGLGLGNLNLPQQNMQIEGSVNGGQSTMSPIAAKQVIAPLMNNGQSFGGSVNANVSPDLSYIKYGGQLAGKYGDITASIRGSEEQAKGYQGNEYAGSMQYTPEQLKGLIMQAEIQKNVNNFGLDSNKTSGGIAYNGEQWGANITGSRSSDNYGNEDKNVRANINYRW